jgi:histidinol-phosphate aminotransferase
MSSTSASSLAGTLLRQEVLDLHAYHVPDSSGYIKLDAMENPYQVPSALRAEIAEAVAAAAINRYPDPGAVSLKEKIRAATGLPQGMELLLGNGSDELIQLLALALNKPGATMLSVEPSFVMYKMIAIFTGMRYVGVPLMENSGAADFSLDLPATLAAIRREQPALVFLAYPNNPTGNLFPAEAVAQIITASPGLVVLDEAYYAFASDSFIPHLASYPNLLVMRTFSKLGMAGLRLGFLAGSEAWLGQLEKLRLPYNVGVLPQVVAGKLLAHHEVLLQQAEPAVGRNRCYKGLPQRGEFPAVSRGKCKCGVRWIEAARCADQELEQRTSYVERLFACDSGHAKRKRTIHDCTKGKHPGDRVILVQACPPSV